MHPDISEVVRECTYPYLKDSSSVSAHAPILGVPAETRRVLFIDHDHGEVQEKGPGWGADTFQSKVGCLIALHPISFPLSPTFC